MFYTFSLLSFCLGDSPNEKRLYFNDVIIDFINVKMTFSIKPTNNCVPMFGKAEQGEWVADYSFVFGADPQPGMIHAKLRGGDGSEWDEEILLVDKFVEAVNQINPEFVFLGGDITNAYPGDNLRELQLKSLSKSFKSLKRDIPILVAPGNHDIGDVPTPESVGMYTSVFGDDYYSFWVGGVFYIVINSQYYKNDSETKELSNKQCKWLDEQLKSASGSRVIVISHIPPFISDPMEEDTIFNIPLHHRIPLMDKFATSGVKMVMCGHYHRNGGGVWGEQAEVEVVVTSSIGAQLGKQKPGFRLVHVGRDEIRQEV
uniref:serine/threonine-protein phosphatase CPPED1-like isoform X2 n=1 Tax=Ciona intestinalis TaxID=7719 RepID=UPI000EF487D3|nr:serine/threonine-protein phosphatase CPPED1-like isoform X2 [Ciona intestinalis]|eukprot:XP_026692628.1 serine/threonine-protein phosphatase CPPED1-like isoform X2 [Ciona intestinalis]